MAAPTIDLIYQIEGFILRGNILMVGEVSVGTYKTATGPWQWAMFTGADRQIRDSSLRITCLFILKVGVDAARQALQEAKDEEE